MDWRKSVENAKAGLTLLDQARAELEAMGSAAAGDVARYLRMSDAGVELDEDAIRATLERPYTLVPINEHEAWLIHWKGVRMPVVGWVVAHEPAFIKARVTRSMDMIAPLPQFIRDELGWKAPAHQAGLNAARTSVEVEAGDVGAFRARYGKFLAGKDGEKSFKVRGGEAWIRLVMNLLRDGIMPYRPQPVDVRHWNPGAPTDIVLRDYQAPMVDEFLTHGSILLNLPPGAGKTFVILSILQRFSGRVLILIDTTPGVEHWRYMLGMHAPGQCDVTVGTYQGARKWLEQPWDLIIYDEAQRVPANTFSKAAFAKTEYRIGATGTAWREDNRQHMIVALCGKPVTIPWADLIRAGVLRRPRIIVDIVKGDADKTALARRLVDARKGKALVFCDWLKEGAALAETLDAPFVSGATGHKLDTIREAEVCVVSRVADRAIDLPDLRLVVEVGFMGKSREQEGQRLGRLLHGEFHGEYHALFTEDEYARYRARLFGIEAELAGEVEIEIVQHGGASKEMSSGKSVRVRGKPARVSRPAQANGASLREPQDEIAAVMALPSVAAKLAKAAGIVGARTSPYLRRMFRLCYSAAFSAEEIAEGLGVRDAATVSRMRSACKALLKAGLFVLVESVNEPDRYRVSQDEIGRLKALAGAVNR